VGKALSAYRPNRKLLLSLANKIKRIRKEKGLTIEEFSEICGLHSKYLQTIERGDRNISISVFVQISKAIGVSASKLLNQVLLKM